MRTLAILSRKGGTGKTTVAVHLAAAAHRAGLSTVIADLDPQRSALDWARERQVEGPAVFEAKVGALFTQRLACARDGADLMVLDTRPSSDAECAEAVRWSDLALIVVRPCYFDLKAIVRTVELVTNMGKRGLFVINQAPSRRAGEEPRVILETYETLQGLGLPVAPVGLRYRAAYQNAVKLGLTAPEFASDSLAAFEVDALWENVQRELWPQPAAGAPPVALAG